MGVKAVKLYFNGIIFLATLVLLVLTIMANIASYAHPSTNTWLHFLPVFAPFLIITNILSFIYWAHVSRKILFIPAISLLFSGLYFVSLMGFGISAYNPSQSKQHIKVASFNINYFGHTEQNNAIQIASLAQKHNVDIIAMQEFNPNSFYNINEITGEFHFLGNNAIFTGNKDGIGMAIMSKYPILISNKITFENTGNGFMWADILFEQDTIRIFNLHLQTTGFHSSRIKGYKQVFENMLENFLLRASQAQIVRDYISDSPYPVIVAGDLNDTPRSFVYNTLKGDDLIDSFTKKKFGPGGTYRWTLNLLRIDYILHSKHFNTVEYKMESVALSDHKPIFSVLEYQN